VYAYVCVRVREYVCVRNKAVTKSVCLEEFVVLMLKLSVGRLLLIITLYAVDSCACLYVCVCVCACVCVREFVFRDP